MLKSDKHHRKRERQLVEQLYDSLSEGICIHDLIYDQQGKPVDYRVVGANPAYERILGIPAEEAIGKKATVLYGTEPAPYLSQYAQVVATGEDLTFETHFAPIAKDFSIVVTALGSQSFATLFVDITLRRQAERKLDRKTQAFRALSSANRSLVRASSTVELIIAVCDAVVDEAGYRLAWAGKVTDTDHWIELVAEAGVSRGYIQAILSRQGERDGAPILAKEALDTGTTVLVNNIAAHPQYQVWEAEARRREISSGVAFPLVVDGARWGVLCVYATSPNAFDVEELALLEELVQDVAFGIQTTQHREMLRESRAQLKFIAEHSPDNIFLQDADLRYVWVSRGAPPLKKEDYLGKTDFDLADSKEEASQLTSIKRRVLEQRENITFETNLTLKGEHHFYNVTYEPWYSVENQVIGLAGYVRDITSLKLAEQRVHQALYDIVRSLGQLAERRDPYTAGHQRRVTKLACAIGQAMSLSVDEIEGLEIASSMHDIGKMEVPAEILTKPGKLSDTEFTLIQQHPSTAYEILKGIDFPWPVADVIRQHHERIDGSGYPKGLKGEDILLEARILGVADTVEAMSAHRPYRPGLGIKAALDEIEQNKGTRYDPEVVNTCVQLFSEGFAFES